MSHETPTRSSKRGLKKIGAAAVALSIVAGAGAVGAAAGFRINEKGAKLDCKGGLALHGKTLSEDTPIFPGDPETMIDVVATVPVDFFLAEAFSASTHTGTHLDAPVHFVEDARSVDDLAAEDFVWPAFVIDIRDQVTPDNLVFQLEPADIEAYEELAGEIPNGAMVILQTGIPEDDLLNFEAPGFSFDAVQWMVDERGIKGVGSDNFGPDSTDDENFGATFAILANDGVALPGLANLDAMTINSSIIMAPTVRLADGSGFQTNPLSCVGKETKADRQVRGDVDDRDDDDHDDD